MWWSHESSEELSFGTAQEIWADLRQSIGTERTRWDSSFSTAKSEIKRLQLCLNQLLNDPATLLSPDRLTQAHREALLLVDQGHQMISESRRCLEQISGARQQISAELETAREQKRHAWPWAVGELRREIKALAYLDEKQLAPDYDRLTMERDRLISEVWMLNKEITVLQNYIRTNLGQKGEIWYQTVVGKINVHQQNWQNARQGLPTTPIPQTQQLTMDQRMTGVVKWYDASRRQGVINPINGGEEISVSRESLNGIPYLQKGQRVGFTLKQGANGSWAEDVIRLR